ncbi:MAG: cold shock domain-containing protein, partial [Cyanobacteria bacterium J06649_4]
QLSESSEAADYCLEPISSSSTNPSENTASKPTTLLPEAIVVDDNSKNDEFSTESLSEEPQAEEQLEPEQQEPDRSEPEQLVAKDKDESKAKLVSLEVNHTNGQNNPWLTAIPKKHRSENSQQAEETLTKSGTVKLLFTLKKGNFHGYIAPDDGSKDILFHQKYINGEIFEHIQRGSQVTATVKYMEGKAYATQVTLS